MSNFKVNLSARLKNHLGDEQNDPKATLGAALSNLLGAENATDKNKIGKIFLWSQDAGRNNELNVDKPDLDYIKDMVVNSQAFPAFVKAQVLAALDSAESGEKEAKKGK